MKLTKLIIIIIFTVIISTTFGGYSIYNHYQIINTIQSNTDKSDALNSAKSWKNSSVNISVLSINIFLIHTNMIMYKDSDLFVFDKLNGYYKEIAEYLGTTETHLDEICSMGQEASEKEIARLISKKYGYAK